MQNFSDSGCILPSVKFLFGSTAGSLPQPFPQIGVRSKLMQAFGQQVNVTRTYQETIFTVDDNIGNAANGRGNYWHPHRTGLYCRNTKSLGFGGQNKYIRCLVEINKFRRIGLQVIVDQNTALRLNLRACHQHQFGQAIWQLPKRIA